MAKKYYVVKYKCKACGVPVYENTEIACGRGYGKIRQIVNIAVNDRATHKCADDAYGILDPTGVLLRITEEIDELLKY